MITTVLLGKNDSGITRVTGVKCVLLFSVFRAVTFKLKAGIQSMTFN